MKCLIAISVAATALLLPYGRAVAFLGNGTGFGVAPTSTNVNERYRVESVDIRHWQGFLSRGLARDMKSLEGKPYRVQSVETLEKRIRYELPGYSVDRKIEKGSRPDFLRVFFDVERNRKTIELRSPRLLYSSSSQFSLGADANMEAGPLRASLGAVTENDERLERFTGWRGAFLVPLGISGRFRLGLLGESYRTQWAPALANNPDLYRARQNWEPSLVWIVRPGLQVHAGLSFQELDMQTPAVRALGTRHQAANALFTTLRYTRQWEQGLTGSRTLSAGYSLRAATNNLASDYSYRRHTGEARFTVASGDNPESTSSLSLSMLLGGIDGVAPLFDRFVLGNSRTLRGWNRFDLSPTGGNRMAHLSLEGQHEKLCFVYDSGTIWDPGRPKRIRHSAGLGIRVHGWTAMVALPLRSGAIEPIFLLGMNF